MSDTQVALSLLNMGIEVTSDSYQFFGATHAVNFFKHNYQEDKADDCPPLYSWDSWESDSEDSDSKDSDSMFLMNPDSSPFGEGVNKHSMNFGPAPFYTVWKNWSDSDESDDESDEPYRIPVHYPTHWYFRRADLCHLTWYEYHALIDIKPLSASDYCYSSEEDNTNSEDSDSELVNSSAENESRKTCGRKICKP